MNVNCKRVWASCWLDWFIEYGSTATNWMPKQNLRKASDSVVHQWIARCMESMTEKVVRDSWDRSVFAGWWCAMLERALFELVMLYVAMPNSGDWDTSGKCTSCLHNSYRASGAHRRRVCDSDEDEDMDEKDEKQQMEAERLVERLEECEDMEDEEDKENRPPATESFPWDSDCLTVQRMAEEAEQRKRQRGRI